MYPEYLKSTPKGLNEAPCAGLASESNKSGVSVSAQPGCLWGQVEKRELWVWRSVGVKKLLSGGVRLEGTDREEPEAQMSIGILVRWLLPMCCSGTLHDHLLHKPSLLGLLELGGVFQSMKPPGVYHKVLELSAMTALVPPVFLLSSNGYKSVPCLTAGTTKHIMAFKYVPPKSLRLRAL